MLQKLKQLRDPCETIVLAMHLPFLHFLLLWVYTKRVPPSLINIVSVDASLPLLNSHWHLLSNSLAVQPVSIAKYV